MTELELFNAIRDANSKTLATESNSTSFTVHTWLVYIGDLPEESSLLGVFPEQKVYGRENYLKFYKLIREHRMGRIKALLVARGSILYERESLRIQIPPPFGLPTESEESFGLE
jgi:hypothetical protein